MELNKEREPRSLINGSNENKPLLSEDALRQMSKSLTAFIPNKLDRLEEDGLRYGFRKQTGEDY